MKLILRKIDSVILDIAVIAEERQGGFYVSGQEGEYFLGYLNEVDIIEIETVPEGIKSFTHKYNGEFALNEDYEPYVPLEEKIKRLENENESLKQTTDEILTKIIPSLIEGGI